ncbi:MAG: hypothetical protein Q7T55_17500, partial [Solirubrobacteraceae bacterium]|nr:hypothetical protein [Solirubrobacteraceae bacterium]
LERLMLDSVRRRSGPAATKLADYAEPLLRDSPGAVATDFELPADFAHFPPGRRGLLSRVEAQLTVGGASSHLFGFGEFAAMYLSVWSNACWPAALPADADVIPPAWPDRLPTFVDAPLDAREERGAGDPLSPFLHYDGALRPPVPDARSEAEKAAELARHVESQQQRLQSHRVLVATFEAGLAKVRRTLANEPTYMMFDDHDVTDDWNLNPMWIDRVMTRSLGVTMVRNALLAYALFQDWGNDPRKWKKPEYAALLDDAQNIFPPGVAGPVAAVAAAMDVRFGFGLAGQEAPDGSVGGVSPPIQWHFAVPGPKHLALALDNRTRRSFVSRNGPPGNVAGSLDPLAQTAQTEQIPAGPF